MSNLFRALPSVDILLRLVQEDQDLAALPRPMLKDLVNEFLELSREEIRHKLITEAQQLAPEALTPRLLCYARTRSKPCFRTVLNATGVVVHTNLGRSLLCEDAIQAVTTANRHYSNLEFNLENGKRGSRFSLVEKILCKVSGAEAAMVVNNNASAVLLTLETFAKGKEVVVSRGQLVEIGGSFRIPEVMTKSGATLHEVGATNRTHAHDYENAINEETAALMRVHTSNFRMIGFTKEVSLPELVELGKKHNLPVFDDLGSGNFFDFASTGLPYEPTVQEAVADGADLVTFSGDKVLGGPQAGIIVGKKEYVDQLKKNQLSRALRIDKMTLASLEATMRLYLDPELAKEHIPTLRMITATPEELKSKAQRLARRIRAKLGEHYVVGTSKGASRVGGGAFPEHDLETTLVQLTLKKHANHSPDALKDALRKTDTPMIGRIEQDAFCLDPRTIHDKEFPMVLEALSQAPDFIK